MQRGRPYKALEMFDTCSHFDRLVTVVLPDRQPGCIMRPDHGRAPYPRPTRCLDELALDHDLTHAEDTATVFMPPALI